MAREAGVSKSTVQRIWSDNEIKPHRLETFKISNDANFEEKFWDVIGLYLDPPERALVLCCDEKSQCRALERTEFIDEGYLPDQIRRIARRHALAQPARYPGRSYSLARTAVLKRSGPDIAQDWIASMTSSPTKPR